MPSENSSPINAFEQLIIDGDILWQRMMEMQKVSPVKSSVPIPVLPDLEARNNLARVMMQLEDYPEEPSFLSRLKNWFSI